MADKSVIIKKIPFEICCGGKKEYIDRNLVQWVQKIFYTDSDLENNNSINHKLINTHNISIVNVAPNITKTEVRGLIGIDKGEWVETKNGEYLNDQQIKIGKLKPLYFPKKGETKSSNYRMQIRITFNDNKVQIVTLSRTKEKGKWITFFLKEDDEIIELINHKLDHCNNKRLYIHIYPCHIYDNTNKFTQIIIEKYDDTINNNINDINDITNKLICIMNNNYDSTIVNVCIKNYNNLNDLLNKLTQINKLIKNIIDQYNNGDYFTKIIYLLDQLSQLITKKYNNSSCINDILDEFLQYIINKCKFIINNKKQNDSPTNSGRNSPRRNYIKKNSPRRNSPRRNSPRRNSPRVITKEDCYLQKIN